MDSPSAGHVAGILPSYKAPHLHSTSHFKGRVVEPDELNPDPDTNPAFQVNPDPDTDLDPDPIRIQGFNDQ